jgi:hypothetical protein
VYGVVISLLYLKLLHILDTCKLGKFVEASNLILVGFSEC